MKFSFWQELKNINTRRLYQQAPSGPDEYPSNPRTELLEEMHGELDALGEQALEGLKDLTPDEQYLFLLRNTGAPAEMIQKIANKVDISVLNRLALEKGSNLGIVLFKGSLNNFIDKLSHEAQAALMTQEPTESRITGRVSDEAVNMFFESNSRVFLSNRSIYEPHIPRLTGINQQDILVLVARDSVATRKREMVNLVGNNILTTFIDENIEATRKLLTSSSSSTEKTFDFLGNDTLKRNISAMDMYDSNVKFLKKDNVTYVRTHGGYRAIISDKWSYETQAEIGEKLFIVQDDTVSTLSDPGEIATAEMALTKAQENPPKSIKDESYDPSFFEMTKPENQEKLAAFEQNREINFKTAIEWKIYIDSKMLPGLEEAALTPELKAKVPAIATAFKENIDKIPKHLSPKEYQLKFQDLLSMHLQQFAQEANKLGLKPEEIKKITEDGITGLEEHFEAKSKRLEARELETRTEIHEILKNAGLNDKNIQVIIQQIDDLNTQNLTQEELQAKVGEIIAKAGGNPDPAAIYKLGKIIAQRKSNQTRIRGLEGFEVTVEGIKRSSALVFEHPEIKALAAADPWFKGLYERHRGSMNALKGLKLELEERLRFLRSHAELDETSVARCEKAIKVITSLEGSYSESVDTTRTKRESLAEIYEDSARTSIKMTKLLMPEATVDPRTGEVSYSYKTPEVEKFWKGVEEKADIHRKNLALLEGKDLSPEEKEAMRQALLMGNAEEMSDEQVNNFISVIKENSGSVPKNLDIVGISEDGKNLIVADGNNQTFEFNTGRETLIHTSLSGGPNSEQFEVPKNELGSAQFTYKFFSGFMGIGKDTRASVQSMRKIGGLKWDIMLEELLGQNARNDMTPLELNKSYNLGAQIKRLGKRPNEFFEALLGTGWDETVDQNRAGKRINKQRFKDIWDDSTGLAPSQSLKDLFAQE